MKGQGVHHHGEAEKVDQLSSATDRVRTPQPHRVIQRPVDRLRVRSTRVEALIVGVAWWEGSQVLGPLDLRPKVLFGEVEAHPQLTASKLVRDPVLAIEAPSAVGIGTLTQPALLQLYEDRLADVVQLDHTARHPLGRKAESCARSRPRP